MTPFDTVWRGKGRLTAKLLTAKRLTAKICMFSGPPNLKCNCLDLFFFFFSLLVHVRTRSDLHSGGKKRPHRDFPHFIQLKKAQKPHLATSSSSSSKQNPTSPPECALFCRNTHYKKSHRTSRMCTFLHPPHELSHRKEQQAKSHLSSGMCAFSPPDFFDQCALFSRSTIQQKHTFPSECALFRR